MKEIVIDGSHLSGGGQIIRTAVGLSLYTGFPVRIYNIRKNRPNPGLQEQHIQAINVLVSLSSIKVEGLSKGSTEIFFSPESSSIPKRKVVNVEISTAGSIGLVLQPVLIVATKTEFLELRISGGATWGKWAPPGEYIRTVLAYFLAKFGIQLSIEIQKEGFYPRGGAECIVRIETKKGDTKIDLTSRTDILACKGICVGNIKLKQKKVLERIRETVEKEVKEKFNLIPYVDIKYVDSMSTGCGVELNLYFKNTVLGANSLGEPGKLAEIVGKECVENLFKEYRSGAVVDSYLADQILPFLALYGGKIKTSKFSDHTLTNAYVIEKFIPVKFILNKSDNTIEIKKF